MLHWHDLNSRYGFSDGDVYPDGVMETRRVYMFAINKAAEAAGSDYRVVRCDNGGIHNQTLISIIKAHEFVNPPGPRGEPMYATDLDSAVHPEFENDDLIYRLTDVGFRKAVEWAFRAGLDGYVVPKGSGYHIDASGLATTMSSVKLLAVANPDH